MIAVALSDLMDKPEFGNGLGWGIGLGLAGLVIAVLWRSVSDRPAPVAGLVVAFAFVYATHYSTGIPPNVERGLLLLAAAGIATEFLVGLAPVLVIVGAGLAVPGATILTTNTQLPTPQWVETLVIVTVTIGGTLVADFDRRHRNRGWAPMMFAVSALGVYFTVPDTERAMVLLGAALPAVFLAWPFPLASIGAVGAYPVVGALAWVSAFDGRGRLSAIIGGVTCLGLFIAEPIANLLRRGAMGFIDALPKEWWAAIVVGFGQLALAFGASRVAGMRPEVQQAALLATMELAGAVVILSLLAFGDRDDIPDGG